ncbi:MAG: MotA/TolQ/ExbB proton channel family protein [Flavobacteriales bacterium]|nr:MotA/TolQ/ExbB proton channel family protein [Flavobacteriales bacterium]
MSLELFAQIQDVADSARQTLEAIQSSPAQPTEKSISVLELLSFGGWYIMGPLALMSIVAVYILIERTITLNKARKVDSDFMHKIRDYVHSNKLDSARNLCENSGSPVARVIGRGIARIGSPSKEIEAAMEGAGRLEVARLERGIGLLSLFAKLAPMFGFIGTIIGVINIFYEISLSDNISVGNISEGLYQKMVTSASGLIVGIVSFVAYFVVNNLVERVVEKIDGTGQQFLDMLRETPKA